MNHEIWQCKTQYTIRNISKGISTLVENSLQINLFLQNKPNFQKAKMNVSLTLTKDYRKNDAFLVRINKANFIKGPK